MTELIKIFASVVAALVCWDAVTALVKTSRSKRHHVRTYRGAAYTITNIGCYFDTAQYGDLLDNFGGTQLPDHMMLRVCAKATREEFQHMCAVLRIADPSDGSESQAFYRCKVEVTP